MRKPLGKKKEHRTDEPKRPHSSINKDMTPKKGMRVRYWFASPELNPDGAEVVEVRDYTGRYKEYFSHSITLSSNQREGQRLTKVVWPIVGGLEVVGVKTTPSEVSGASPCSAFEAIANAMCLVITEEDWQKIYAATRSRLLHSHHDGEDTPNNRVLTQMDISNALFDIRDAFDEQNGNCPATDEGGSSATNC